MAANPYKLFIDDLEIPVTPDRINTKFKSSNEFHKLMNGETYTAIKKSDLDTWSFKLYALSRPHPSVDIFVPQEQIKDKLEELKEEKEAFEFIVIRTTSDPSLKNSICKYMTLEDYSIDEDTEWGTNILITLELKENQPLVTVKLDVKEDGKAYKTKEESKKTPGIIDLGIKAISTKIKRDISNGLRTKKLEGKLK